MKALIITLIHLIFSQVLFSQEENPQSRIWKILECSQPSWMLEYVLYDTGMIVKYECAIPSIGYPAMNGNLFQVKVGKWELDGQTIKVFFTREKWKNWRKSDESRGEPKNGYFHYEAFLIEKDKIMFFEKLKDLKGGNYLSDDISVKDKWPSFEKDFVPTKTAHD